LGQLDLFSLAEDGNAGTISPSDMNIISPALRRLPLAGDNYGDVTEPLFELIKLIRAFQ